MAIRRWQLVTHTRTLFDIARYRSCSRMITTDWEEGGGGGGGGVNKHEERVLGSQGTFLISGALLPSH